MFPGGGGFGGGGPRLSGQAQQRAMMQRARMAQLYQQMGVPPQAINMYDAAMEQFRNQYMAERAQRMGGGMGGGMMGGQGGGMGGPPGGGMGGGGFPGGGMGGPPRGGQYGYEDDDEGGGW
ncbi:hypothetical protein LTR56_022938 [Elasticomyces elasticus]|nr:hypothetical protein LTR56_022938 [Elasticomyces elasticus]KAK3627047.1 hypothetical protein LTR22_022906 [Elasticomyces elasticus]KAK4907469.1 hypothetical protein LTR49_023493 [Elasticomyces elasticus]KAK5747885.1 hypothetical protein LTS12_022083 [Elasticomyces elasticus]